MGVIDWLFGKPCLFIGASKRRGGLFGWLGPMEPLRDPDLESPPDADGSLIRKYGAYIGGGFETITSVGDALLTDLLGSTYDAYYISKDTFYDFRTDSVWLVNTRNQFMVKLVLARVGDLIGIGEPSIEIGSTNRFLELSHLNGKPWDPELIRQAGIDLPV